MARHAASTVVTSCTMSISVQLDDDLRNDPAALARFTTVFVSRADSLPMTAWLMIDWPEGVPLTKRVAAAMVSARVGHPIRLRTVDVERFG